MTQDATAAAPCHSAGAVPLLSAASAACWHALAALEARPRQAAAALAATAQVLESGAAGSSTRVAFVAFYRQALTAPAGDFTAVWTHPGAYYLIHLAYQLLAHELTGEPLSPQAQAWLAACAPGDVPAGLDAALEGLCLLHLALGLRCGWRVRLPRPLRVAAPWHVPGTHWLLDGAAPLSIAGVEDGRILGTVGDTPFAVQPAASGDGAVRALGVTVVDRGDWALALNPFAFAELPGLTFTEPVRAAGQGFHAQHHSLLDATLDSVARYQPASYRQLRASLRVLGLKPVDAGDYTNMSYSDLPGSAILAVVQNPLDLADTLIHELHHNRLFGLEADGPFLDSAADAAAIQYSPWRSDPRPFYGLLHAVYVHVPVWHYWRAVWQAQECDAPHRAYAADRLVRYAAQLERGVQGLAQAPLTVRGRDLLDELRVQVTHIRNTLAALGVPADPAAVTCLEDGRLEPQRDAQGRSLTVGEALREHARRSAPATAAAGF